MYAWEQFLQKLERELGKETVRKWLRPLKVVRYDACNLYLEARDAFHAMWFEEHIRKKVIDGFQNNNRKKIRVHVSVANVAGPNKQTVVKKKKVEKPVPQDFSLVFDELDPQCRFKDYIPTKTNQLTLKVLCQVVGYDFENHILMPQTELASYNPIYISGQSGTGKTHLLMSCAHALQQRGLKALYSRANTFTDHVVSAIRSGEMIKFRQQYRNIDVLLVDDVPVFSRKGATQEEFFHTFNTLHLAGKQIILSANCLPSDLQEVEPRLVSRFEWGVVLHLDPLKRDEMRQMLFYHAESLSFKLNPKVAEFILDTFTSSAKALNRALKALILRAHLNERSAFKAPPPTTVAVAREYLADLVKEEERAALTPDKIIHHVAAHFGITSEDIFSKSQNRECVFPRQLAMFFCRNELKMPYAKIGYLFARDHSTVMSSVKQIQKAIDNSEKEASHAKIAIQKTFREKP